jgi:hypothetical protein
MALTFLFEGSVAKHAGAPGENEDVLRTAAEKGRLVVADGASESFDAQNWARLLANRMINEELSFEAVVACAEEYGRLHDPGSLSWSKAAAYERGSFAALLVAQDCPERSAVRVTAAGDCLAVWVVGRELVASAPYSRSEQFRDNPTLLATRLAMNPTDESHWTTWEWSYPAPRLALMLCMTDALGAWLLSLQERGDPSALATLCGLRGVGDAQKFAELVERERAAGRLRRDDTSLIVVSVTPT